VSKRIVALLALPFVISACAQTLVYQASYPGDKQRLIDHRRQHARPFIGNRQVDRETRLFESSQIGKLPEGWGEYVACWRLVTRDGARWSAREWMVEAVLAGSILLLEIDKPVAKVLLAENLTQIQAPEGLGVELGDQFIRARTITRVGRELHIADDQGRIHTARLGQLRYHQTDSVPPGKVYGLVQGAEAYPLDADLIQGFLIGYDTGSVLLKNYRTVSMNEVMRWEFDKEWGPWSYILAPYLSGRWLFTKHDIYERCDTFP